MQFPLCLVSELGNFPDAARELSPADIVSAAGKEACFSSDLHSPLQSGWRGRRNLAAETDTCCPACGKVLIRRSGFGISSNQVDSKGCCPDCGEMIAGVGMEGH